MNKLAELSIVLPLAMTEELSNQVRQCSCCEQSMAIGAMACAPTMEDSKILISWVCPGCLPEVNRTGGQNIQRGKFMSDEDVEARLTSAESWLDAELLKRNKNQPFVRRPLFAETVRAKAAGLHIAEGAAIVVVKQGNKHLRRVALPYPFPWEDGEFIAGATAAREALAMAKEIKRGNVEVMTFGGNVMAMATSSTAMARIHKAGRGAP